MKRQYKFSYDNDEAVANFAVDTEKFTNEMAMATLTFFSWDYDKEGDPIDEVMKKYALKAIELATFNYKNTFGVIDLFKNEEGYGNVDGSIGVTLTRVELFEFEDYNLDMVVS